MAMIKQMTPLCANRTTIARTIALEPRIASSRLSGRVSASITTGQTAQKMSIASAGV